VVVFTLLFVLLNEGKNLQLRDVRALRQEGRASVIKRQHDHSFSSFFSSSPELNICIAFVAGCRRLESTGGRATRVPGERSRISFPRRAAFGPVLSSQSDGT
jgi:hypothetical protein